MRQKLEGTSRSVGVGIALSAALLVAAMPGLARAQGGPEPTRLQAGRPELQALLGRPEALQPGEAELIRRRLQDGDFQVNDRVVVRVFGEASLTDTFSVRAGPQLEMPALTPLPLAGLLRSELEAKVRAHVARYVKDPQVTAVALIRVGVTGMVAKPGYYSVPAGLDLSQILMSAGGLSSERDINKSTITRNGTLLYDRAAVQAAFGRGASPDQLNLQSGDAIEVGRRPAANKTAQTIGIVTAITGLATTIIYLLVR
jgi:protein involved in polysaccharide export with SLBB domain